MARTNARTMKTASRTLVKSPPEVWEQLDHPGRMQGLMSALVGRAAEVTVYEREEESKLAWRASDDAWIEVEIAEKGWGTNVSVTAENGSEPTKLEGWLDAVIDELATPTKRPFEGMSKAVAETPPLEPVRGTRAGGGTGARRAGGRGAGTGGRRRRGAGARPRASRAGAEEEEAFPLPWLLRSAST